MESHGTYAFHLFESRTRTCLSLLHTGMHANIGYSVQYSADFDLNCEAGEKHASLKPPRLLAP